MTSDRTISAIVPTIGRPESLTRLLVSLVQQTHRVDDVVVADGSSDSRTADVIANPRWENGGLMVRRVSVSPPHAVQQREAAIAASSSELLLMLDDDVELDSNFVSEVYNVMENIPDAVAIVGVDDRQSGDGTTRLTRGVLKNLFGYKFGDWQGKMVGPLLRFNYWPLPSSPKELEWLGNCGCLIKRAAYASCGGYSGFFLDRSTINEDMDLAIKLRRSGSIYLCASASFTHHHDLGGRVRLYRAARDDMFNRYMILRCTMQRSAATSLANLCLLVVLDATAGLLAVRRGRKEFHRTIIRLGGQLSGIGLALRQKISRS